jgi:hypothetical protein
MLIKLLGILDGGLDAWSSAPKTPANFPRRNSFCRPSRHAVLLRGAAELFA